MTIEQTAGDQSHESAGHAVSRAIPENNEVSAICAMEPEEVPADDVSRFPDQEVVMH